jgi:hypothetical protein
MAEDEKYDIPQASGPKVAPARIVSPPTPTASAGEIYNRLSEASSNARSMGRIVRLVAPQVDPFERRLDAVAAASGLTNRPAHKAASKVLLSIQVVGLSPERIVPTRDGEIAFYFRGRERLPGGAHRYYGAMVCDSDGDITSNRGPSFGLFRSLGGRRPRGESV